MSRPDWDALGRSLAGRVLLPGSDAYEAQHKAFNARFHEPRPQAVVSCATPHDVAETIGFARRHGVAHVPRGGGHCFAGHSSTPGVVIDLTPMSAVSVTGGLVTVGAGARLGDVYEALQPHGLTIPGGTCPPVGIAGLTLGGGLGILGRTYGTTSDHLVRAEVVLADGRLVECGPNRHGDLFWALRGAGAANFGVVTSFTFRTVPAPEATNVHAAWPFAAAAAVVDAWQGWAPTGPDQLAASLKVTVAGDVGRPPSVDVYAAYLGSEADAADLLDALVVQVGSEPHSASCRLMSHPETTRFWADLGADEPGTDVTDVTAVTAATAPPQPYLFSRSEFFRRPLPADAVAALLDAFSQPGAPGESRELDFMPWGGAYNRIPPDATAFVHRHELFQLKHAAVVAPAASRGEKDGAHRWVARSWASVHPWASGRVFQNFADPELPDWPSAYYGTNLASLREVKARYDPTGVFRSPQSLSPP